MPSRKQDTLQSAETRAQLTEAQPQEATADLTKGLKPLADKPKLATVEDPTVRERREVSAQVRGGDDGRQKQPNEDSAVDDRPAEEVARLQAENADLPVGPDITIEDESAPRQPDVTLDDYLPDEVARKRAAELATKWQHLPEKDRPKS